MNTDSLCQFLLLSLAINFVILLVWFFEIVFARNFIKKIHSRWFQLSDATFDAIHYGGMVVYMIGIFLFNLAPVLALYFMGSDI